MKQPPAADWHAEENAARYAAFAHTASLYRVTSRFLVSVAGVQPGATVLDLACGTGVTTQAALEALDGSGHVYALDSSLAQLAHARAAVTARNVTFVHASADRPPAQVRRVDHILCNSAFWQLPLEPTLDSLARVARAGATLVVNLPAAKVPRASRAVASDLQREGRRARPSLEAMMQQLARAELGYCAPPRLRDAAASERYEDRLARAVARSRFELRRSVGLSVPVSPRERYDWYSIPLFRQNVLGAMEPDESQKILDRAYELWSPDAELEHSHWVVFVFVLRAP